MDATEQVRIAAADREALQAALAEAHIVPLLLCLVQLTGKTGYLDEAMPYIAGAWDYMQTIPLELQARIRADLHDAIIATAAESRPIPPTPPEPLFRSMIDVAAGQPVPEIYLPVFREEAAFGGVDLRKVDWRKSPAPLELEKFNVIVIGAGFSGIAMSIRLQQMGIPHVVIDKNAEVGGTWLENVYPGCGVDTPCHFYSYAFEVNSGWTEYFAKRAEIHAYILKCVEKYRVRERIRFKEEVVRADYDELTSTWRVLTRRNDGTEATLTCNALISAVGALNRPALPDIPGLKEFAGPCFHTAQWDQSVDLEGKRIAMIGTGASGMQTGPSIAPIVDKLTIFQRSAHWSIRHPLYHVAVSPAVGWAMQHVPFYASWVRLLQFWAASDLFHPTLKMDTAWNDAARSLNAANHQLRQDLIAYMTAELGSRADLLPKVTPDYPPFGKRMLRDNHWYKMLQRENVELVTGRVDRIERNSVVSGGVAHPTDVIVLATGFQAGRMLWPMTIRGKGGVSLRDIWGDDNPRAHLGVTVPGFPNFFMIYGPNTNLAHGGSAIFHSEVQVRYIALALREMIERDWRSMEVKRQPFEAYNERLDEALATMSWSHPGVTNWYKNSRGRVVMNSPWRLVDYRNMLAEVDVAEFEVRGQG